MAAKRLIHREGTETFDGLSPLMARLLTARGITSSSELDHSLAGLQPPGEMLGLDAAVARLQQAKASGERVLVIGDYDADGATSAALMVSAMRQFGFADVHYLVPDRFSFGYGLSAELVTHALSLAPRLLVTVDNGITSIDGVAAANAAGIDVIVTDHHLPGEQLPAAVAIVNPNQEGCPFAAKHTAGVGVAFYVMSALRRRLREAGELAASVNMADFLDLVALGTVADVVTLDHNNRILVNEGLRRIRAGRARPGIRALISVAGLDATHLRTQDLAFALAPRLNAAGRLESMADGIECLLASEDSKALLLAGRLQTLNEERKVIEKDMRDQASDQLSLDSNAIVAGEKKGLCVFDERWHEGVVGIIASRLKDEWYRPVIAFALADDGDLKGSARSIQGVHIRDVIADICALRPGLVRRYGGHAMAAGLTLAADQLDTFTELFEATVARRVDGQLLEATISSDGAPGEYSLAVAREVCEGFPWGQGMPEPIFDGEFEILSQRIVGGRHLKLLLRPLTSDVGIDAIAFNQPGLLESRRQHLAYRLDINRFRGRETLQLIVECLHLTQALP